MCVGRPTRCFTKLGSTRLAVEFIYLPHLPLAVEPSTRVVIPLFAAIAPYPLLAVTDFDHRLGRLAGGADEFWFDWGVCGLRRCIGGRSCSWLLAERK